MFAHGFPISLYEKRGLLQAVVVVAHTLTERVTQEKYTPLATEARGVYRIVVGSYLMGTACHLWIGDYRKGRTSTDFLGCTPTTWIQCSKHIVVSGVFDVTHLPCTVIRGTYDLTKKAVRLIPLGDS